MVRDRCTCEYCCFVRDEEDDKQMAMEYEVAMFRGKDMFDELKVGDSVTYYQIPHDERKVVYNLDRIKWESIEEIATKKFQGVVTLKNENRIELNNNKQRITPAECWAWGMRKNKTS